MEKNKKIKFFKKKLTLLMILSTVAFSANSSNQLHIPAENNSFPVVGHRGYAGLIPEETKPSYEAAIISGADYVELDIHMTKDCQLIARHNPWMKDNTNIEEVAKENKQIAMRKRIIPGRYESITWKVDSNDRGPDKYLTDLVDKNDYKSRLKALVVDGEDHVNDWSVSDFTLSELQNLIKGTTYDAANERPELLNNLFPIISFQELIDLVKEGSKKTGRPVGIFAEVKNPIWNNGQAIANGCGKLGEHPYEDAILKTINENNANKKDSEIVVISFEPESLKYLKNKGLKTSIGQLMDGNGVDYHTGKVIYNTNDEYTFVSGRPYSWTLEGKPEYFDQMLTSEGLKEIATYADIIGPWKMELMTFLNTKKSGDSKDQNLVDSVTPNDVISKAHQLGLRVIPFTFRNESKYLVGKYKNNPLKEFLDFYNAGVDGVITDFTSTGVAARSIYVESLKEN